jgi:hypothetical protein
MDCAVVSIMAAVTQVYGVPFAARTVSLASEIMCFLMRHVSHDPAFLF